ncbi:ABC transporter substrate-binding protein [Streptomyces sp. NPDC004726]
MKAIRSWAGAAAAATLLLTTACSSDSGSSDGRTTIRVATLPGSTQAIPEIIAKSQGMFKKAGLEVETVNIKSGPEATTLLIAGDVDITPTVTSTVLPAIDRVEIVAGQTKNIGSELVRRKGYEDAAAEKPYPQNLAGMAGAKVGVAAIGGYFQILTEQMYREAGVDPAKVRFIGVGGGQTQMGALSSGQVDVTIANPIVTTTLVNSGKAELLVRTRDVPSIKDFPEAVYVTKRGLSDEKRADLAKYLGAIEEAIAWSKDPANQQAFAADVAKAFGFKDKDTAKIVSQIFAPDQGNQIGQFGLGIEKSGFDALSAFMLENKLIKKPVTYEQAVKTITPVKPAG